MNLLVTEIDAFLSAREAERAEARRNAAFFLMCGIDLDDALRADPGERRKMIARLERMIERERLKGNRRHWSYDLNRHIALKQAADKLRHHDGHGEGAAQTAAADSAVKAFRSGRGKREGQKRRRRTAFSMSTPRPPE